MNHSSWKKRCRVLCLSALAALCSSCAIPKIPLSLYAVKGEATKSAPIVKGYGQPSGLYVGTIHLQFPGEEVGEGPYSGIANLRVTSSSYSGNSSGTLSGNADWDTSDGQFGSVNYLGNIYQSTYGRSFSQTLEPGQIPIQAMMITNKGRRLELIAAVGSGTNHGYGIAKDNLGNVFKVIF